MAKPIALVVDNGSHSCKAGFANENTPRVFIPSIVGHPRDELKGTSKKDCFIGGEVRDIREMLALRNPIEFGVINNWDGMEKLWQYIFHDQLRAPPDEHPVLLTRPPHNPRGVTEKMTEIMFETFNTPALYIAVTGELSLLSIGQDTGLVLDSGEITTHAMRIYKGRCASLRCDRVDYAGQDLTSYLTRKLREKGCSFTKGTEYDVVRDIKRTMCCVSSDFESDLSSSGTETIYQLPDGSKINIGNERFHCPEILFNPKTDGIEFPGIHELINITIQKADASLHKDMYNNIVLSGGTTMFPGIAERLTKELKCGLNVTAEVNVIADKNRDYLAWTGGAMAGNLSTFEKICVKIEEYDEVGPALCTQKYF
ncbi:actin, muscle-like [Mizuhopecten yessoensis]|uniref:Actin, muscle n=1 Tax=Mizuhopecten yessoensis TaxID=6573 RepID=A0A210PE57_MIZYE|nr:actin, muscle-like [Mizuhopecten yessoensis]XP_021343847.1 actin, muscle-like [Mizuhopecten yessoensis]OWF34768.1 Actin, muscle [Mizuhopecten yessoensis]